MTPFGFAVIVAFFGIVGGTGAWIRNNAIKKHQERLERESQRSGQGMGYSSEASTAAREREVERLLEEIEQRKKHI